MATENFYEGYVPAWILGRNKGPPVETNPKPPAPKPEDKIGSPIELKVPFCCDGCQESLQRALIESDDVDSVKLEPDFEKVTITGKVKPEDALERAKEVVRTSEFWLRKNEEGKENLADNVQQRSEVEQLRTEDSSLLDSRDEKRGGSREKKGELTGPKAEGILWSHPQVGMAQSQYDDGIHSNVQATVGQLHPVCNDSAITAPGTSGVDDLIRDVESRREDGYFLSSEWLLGLEQKQRETLTLILSRAGFSETYHTGMTVLFERSGDVPIAVTTLIVEDSIEITDPLPASPTVKYELMKMSLDEKAHEKCMTNSNALSLEQKPTTHQERNTSFERIGEHVGLPRSNLCNNPTSTSDKTDVGPSDSDTGMPEASGRDGLLRNDELKGKLDIEDTRTEPFGLDSTDEKRSKPDSTRACIPQMLEVTCRSSSESSTSTGPLVSSQNLHQRSGRRLCGDSFATLPKHCKGYTLPTKVDKVIPMTAFDFRGTSECLEVPISLKVSIGTSVSCCLRDDDNRKKMRVKFLTIGGEVRNMDATKPNVKALVLKSIRTSVVARVDSYESINLDLEEEYSQPPRRRVLETLPISVTGDQTKREDRVWLALSGIKPENDEVGSTTVELLCHVVRTCKAQLQGTINGAHVLLFKDPRPLTLEGYIYTFLHENSLFELDVRYQLEFSYFQPCKPFPKECRPYLPGERKTVVVDFDCILEYQAGNLLLC